MSGGALDSVHHADLFDLCAALEPASVDMILCDLPYGTTACAWDTVIPFEPMWAAFKRIVKPRAAIVLTASQPFTSALVMSNPKWFRCEWIWDKGRGVNFAQANFHPMKAHESVLVFGAMPPIYNPQYWYGSPYKTGGGKRSNIIQGLGTSTAAKNRPETVSADGRRFPLSIISFDRSIGHHPTQKPVALFRYLIRTYTRPGDLVVDPCVGSGTTALAARAEGRRYIVGDSSAEYVAIAERRLAEPYTLPMLGLFESEGA